MISVLANFLYSAILRSALPFLGLAFCLGFFVAHELNAQVTQPKRPFALRVDVDLVTTQVIVVDKKGNPVHNLKQENFRLYDDGKEQVISLFDEVSNEPSGPEITNKDQGLEKTILIVFDDNSLTPDQMKPARDSAMRFVKKYMGPKDLFAVASSGLSSLNILQSFTDDREKVLAAAGRPGVSYAATNSIIEEESSTGWQPHQTPDRIPHSGGQDAAMKSSEEAGRRTKFSGIFNPSLQSMLERLKGRKSILIYTNYPLGYATKIFKGNVAYHLVEPKSDFETDLDKYGTQLSNYYVLGFQPGNPNRDGAYHNLEVKTDAKGVRLDYPPNYADRRPVDTLVNSKQEKSLLAVAISSTTAAQLPLAFRASYFYVSPRLAKVMISAKIRTENIKLNKNIGKLVCDLNVIGIAYNEEGNISARFSETLHLNIDSNKEKDFRNVKLSYGNYFKLRPGKYRLKLAVSDKASNVGSMEQSLEVPAPPESGLAVSSLVLSERLSPLPELIHNIQDGLLDDSDPFVHAGTQISPSIDNRLPVNSPLAVFFKLYNLVGNSVGWKLEAKAKLIRDSGEELVLPPIPVDAGSSKTGNSEVTIGINLPFQNTKPGKYRLQIEISEAASSQSATVQTDLELVK
jgi:hypothetical protein